MSKSLTMIALAVGFVTLTAGSALAAGGCSGATHTQSVSLETQTASTGDATLQQTPKPETKAN